MTKNRFELWVDYLREIEPKNVLEIGVYRGKYSKYMLDSVPSIENYYMIDPWRVLDDWNKPLNTKEITKDFDIAMDAVVEHKSKVKVLRGTTLEMIDQIEDNTIDFCYIDGDHTLRGITTDLQKSFYKVKPDGFIGGDDFCARRQHAKQYEPTLVFPYSIFFAEAMDCKISQLPHSQFLIDKSQKYSYEYKDQNYKSLSVNAVVR